MLKERLNQQIKEALLSGNKTRAEVLRGLKAAILNEEVAQRVRDTGLPDEQILVVFAREAKKRAESADVYAKAGHQDRADVELAEKAVIEEFLPKQLSNDELSEVVKATIAELGDSAQMGPIIGAVKKKVGQSADGGRIAAAVKQQLG